MLTGFDCYFLLFCKTKVRIYLKEQEFSRRWTHSLPKAGSTLTKKRVNSIPLMYCKWILVESLIKSYIREEATLDIEKHGMLLLSK